MAIKDAVLPKPSEKPQRFESELKPYTISTLAPSPEVNSSVNILDNVKKAQPFKVNTFKNRQKDVV